MGRFVYHYFCFLPKGKKDLCHVKSEKISNEEVKLYRLHHINKGILYGKFFLRKPHEFLAKQQNKQNLSNPKPLSQLQNKRHVVTGPYNPITLTIINTVVTSFPSSNLGAYEFKRMD